MTTRFSENQRVVIETWGQGLAVMAGAGSGKTTTLVAKCEALIQRKPDARIVAVSFTERSASDLRLKLSSKIELSPHWVMTIHGLCGSILRENAAEAGLDGEERVLSETESQELWQRAWNSLWLGGGLPAELEPDLFRLLEREGRNGLEGLISRVRGLLSFGVLDVLRSSSSMDEQAIARITEWILLRYEKLKSRQGALDFDDLEKYAERALQNEEVRKRYQQKFDLVLVDEFQDTNPMQSRILRAFSRPDRSNLCVVGDPKQSIYRFRGADVSVFEEFCEELPVRVTLTQNFRSRPGVIKFVNQSCASIFGESGLRYDPLEAMREAEKSASQSVHVLQDVQPAELAGWLKQQATQEGVDWGKYVLLLRKIRGNENWIRALAAEGIPLAVGSGGLFWSDPRVREMVAMLKWWQDPINHRFSGAVFLRAPWVGIPDQTLDEWQKQDPSWQIPFFESGHPLAEKLKLLRDQSLRPGELLIELFGDEALETELGVPLLGLWHRAEELSHAGRDFFHVVSELSSCVEDEKRERDVPPPRNLGQLSVLTIHSSKGLEFERVILVDFPSKPARGKASSVLYWNRHQGAYLMPRTPDGDRDDRSEEAQTWKQYEKSQELAESKRVFYVALTRAREKLILVLPPGDPPKTLKSSVGMMDFWRAWVEPCVRDEMRRDVVKHDKSDEMNASSSQICRQTRHLTPNPFAGVRWVRPRHSVTEWNLLMRCPKRYAAELNDPTLKIHERFVSRAEQIENQSQRSVLTAAEIGTRVHRALELRDWDLLAALESEVSQKRFRAEPLIEWVESFPGMRGNIPAWSELAFEIPVVGEVLVGAIDRVVYDPDQDQYSVIDFKVTSEKKVRDPEQLLELYHGQLELYVWALGKVEPSSVSKTRAWLVAITPERVVQIEVPLMAAPGVIEKTAHLAGQIVSLGTGVTDQIAPAQPGRVCEDCALFRKTCQVV